MTARPDRVFLLSPARSDGKRAAMLQNPASGMELACALRSDAGAPLQEVYAFSSSLYFRGKLAYATRFARPLAAAPSMLVITPGHGLCRGSTRVRATDLAAIGAIEVDAQNPAFVGPLLRDARLLDEALPGCEVVLLGSVATGKYVEPLLEVFGARLLFPREFVGRGDMSRGGLLLRAAREGRELELAVVAESVRRGPRARRIADMG
jgi:hypothetical protein